eukprot:TRINITY_DN113591_c0_g1_i1.p1 TRINITY_DN113591_c0_g1~~TRINITY_DN113591_c0_g1_i1.p1  ORF type:complete len:380 (-),score=33.39 TRINITY_DN113591_c0_g1_i1:156-1295(-)
MADTEESEGQSVQINVTWIDGDAEVRDVLRASEKPAVRVPIGLVLVDPWSNYMLRMQLAMPVRFDKYDRRIELFDLVRRREATIRQSVERDSLIRSRCIRTRDYGQPVNAKVKAATQKALALSAVLQEIRGLFKTCSSSSISGSLEATVSDIDCKLGDASQEYLKTHHESSLLSLLLACSPEFSMEAENFVRHAIPPDRCKTSTNADLVSKAGGQQALGLGELPAFAMANTLIWLRVATQGQLSQGCRRLREMVLQEGKFVMPLVFRAVKGMDRLIPKLGGMLCNRTLTDWTDFLEVVEIAICRPKQPGAAKGNTTIHAYVANRDPTDNVFARLSQTNPTLQGLRPLTYALDVENPVPFTRHADNDYFLDPLPHYIRLS